MPGEPYQFSHSATRKNNPDARGYFAFIRALLLPAIFFDDQQVITLNIVDTLLYEISGWEDIRPILDVGHKVIIFQSLFFLVKLLMN